MKSVGHESDLTSSQQITQQAITQKFTKLCITERNIFTVECSTCRVPGFIPGFSKTALNIDETKWKGEEDGAPVSFQSVSLTSL